MNILEVKNLTKKYGDFTAVNNINFAIKKGEIFGFLGPNGAGKTSTINMLTGLSKVTEGSINIFGIDVVKDVKKAQSIMGIVPDESNLYPEMDGFENLCFCASLYGIGKEEREKRAKKLLEQFGLDNVGKKPFKAYSKGMKRKLTIAAGIIHNPKILFLDEPTTGIDVESARQIRSLIMDLNKKGTTVFITTHYIEEAERLCDRIAFIVKGEIVRIGTVDELMQDVQKEKIIQFTLDSGILDIKETLQKDFYNYKIEIIDNNTFRLYSINTISLMSFMKYFDERGFSVYEAKVIKPTLEEVFVKITGIEASKMKKEKEGGRK
ncbi:ABC-2 type transport system ATP-binding protein [Caloranaerobacter azorensis DSM 13643]|uniref:ABC-2 type transport system ATP-binding protein n=1 Tax=Caloranaerobacter azorensis DSM 13643 TaxID=1121264 RepID=A0A1M5T8J5_9FIRM|nr:ABC transporter ATP-binding protein [Caloranaerobacter azorensis]SHH47034.1 ABC-2 type transport system ATP-binding protein [Caloranaerobacter azorensis DSM 13643]